MTVTIVVIIILAVFVFGVWLGTVTERRSWRGRKWKPPDGFNRVGDGPLPESFDMDKLWAAICRIESGNYQYAYNKKSGAAGIAQIKMICLQDCNELVGFDIWSHEDRFDAGMSRDMFNAYIIGRCPKPRTYEKISRTWRGGPQGYYDPDTLPYWEKVKAELQG